MFYKIHYQVVPVCMSLTLKLHLQPTCTENMITYMIPSSVCDYHLQSLYPLTGTVRDWNTLSEETVQLQTCPPRQLKTTSGCSLHTSV